MHVTTKYNTPSEPETSALIAQNTAVVRSVNSTHNIHVVQMAALSFNHNTQLGLARVPTTEYTDILH